MKTTIITHIFYTNNFVSVPCTLSTDKIKVISHKNTEMRNNRKMFLKLMMINLHI